MGGDFRSAQARRALAGNVVFSALEPAEAEALAARGRVAAHEAGAPAGEVELSLTPFNQVVKDYFAICESYFDAVKRLPPAQIEAIDAGRREIHTEGSRLLLERLEGKVETDLATARRLFTLICVLRFKG